MGSEVISEPTSPKVTCAGQIKVRPKNNINTCKSWQSVMEDIERIHNNRKKKKRSTSWMESSGFKKEVMQFLTCLRSIRFDFRCFGSFPQSDITTDDDDEDEDEEDNEDDEDEDEEDNEDDEEYQENRVGGEEGETRTVFSKWFAVLKENQNSGGVFCKEAERKDQKERLYRDDSLAAPFIPPPNALLLMRCRSAPAKSWLEEKQEHEELAEELEKEEEEEEEDRKREEKKRKNLKTPIEEEKISVRKESLVVMRYDTDFYKLSSDIAKETWVVGGMRDLLSRSRSWKR